MIWTEERKERARERCRYWQGTPHAHAIRIQKVGIDCVHLVVDVLEYAGAIPHHEIPRYSPNIGFRGAEQKLIKEFCDRVPADIVQSPFEFGDLIVFNPKLSTNHVALFIDGQLWHALAGQAVHAHPIADFRRSIISGLRLK